MTTTLKRTTFHRKGFRNVSTNFFTIFIFALIQSCLGFLGPHLLRLPVPGRLLPSTPAMFGHALELRTSPSPRRACREDLYQRRLLMADSRFSPKDRMTGSFRKEDRDRQAANRDFSQVMTVVNPPVSYFEGRVLWIFEHRFDPYFFFAHAFNTITLWQIKDLGVYNGRSLQIIDKGRGPYIRCEISRMECSLKRASLTLVLSKISYLDAVGGTLAHRCRRYGEAISSPWVHTMYKCTSRTRWSLARWWRCSIFRTEWVLIHTCMCVCRYALWWKCSTFRIGVSIHTCMHVCV